MRVMPAVRFSVLSASLAALGACSATGAGSQAGNPGGGSGGTSGSGGTGGSIFDDGGGQAGSGGGIGDSCGGETQNGQSVPLDLFIMLDQSGSMSDNGKWGAVTNALNAFFSNPPSPDISVGLQYFGQPQGPCATDTDCGINNAQSTFTCNVQTGQCTECVVPPLPGFPPICLPPGLADSCNAADYAKAEVAIAPLDGAQASLLSQSLSKHGPTTGTPTFPALDGALKFAQPWQAAHPLHKTVVVLATDGLPSGCDDDISHIAQLSAAAANGSPPIQTFVIGVGADLHNLDPVAASGGTKAAIVVDSSQQAFADALKQVGSLAMACEYVLPNGQDGGNLDTHKVNVLFTPGGASEPTVIGKVNGPGDCASGGWYYDNENTPTKVIVCPSTCDTFKNDKQGKVEFRVGCQTKIH